MAVFGDEDLDRLDWLDWRLLQNGAVVLYHRRAILAEDGAWLRGRGYDVRTLDCAAWR